MTDDELIAATARGDGDAFATFYRRHLQLVLAYFRRRVEQPELAFDLTAGTFAAALVASRRYRGGEPLGWLLGIARNKLLESLRRGRVEAAARRALALQPIALDHDDVEAIEAIDLDGLLDALPHEQRRAVRARVLEDRGYEEIARELETSEQVVRQRVSRGLKWLRVKLEERR